MAKGAFPCGIVVLSLKKGENMTDEIVNESGNYHRKEGIDREVSTSIKLSRRDFVKATSAGAFYLALPHLSKVPVDLINFGNQDANHINEEPLVVLVRNNELIGFRGMDEFVETDNGLIEGLSSRHTDEPEFSRDDPIVILVKNNGVTKF